MISVAFDHTSVAAYAGCWRTMPVMTLKKNAVVSGAKPFTEGMLENAHRFRTRNLPAAGSIPKDGDLFEQISL